MLRIRATVVKELNGTVFHGLSCTKCAGRFSCHANLNSLIKQTMGSVDLPSVLELLGLYRTDDKRPDGVTMIPWEMGKQLVWDVTLVDALAPSRLNGTWSLGLMTFGLKSFGLLHLVTRLNFF